jgi:hypothetical protein
MSLSFLAGLPPTIVWAGTSVTAEPAVMIALSPMITPPIRAL